MTNLPQNSASRLLLRPLEVAELVGVTTMSLMRWEADGTFPRRFKLNPNSGKNGAVAYDRAEVEEWLEERRASRMPLAA